MCKPSTSDSMPNCKTGSNLYNRSIPAVQCMFASWCTSANIDQMNTYINFSVRLSLVLLFLFLFWNKWNEISLPRRKNTSLPGPCGWQGKTNKHTSHSSVEMKKSCSRKPAQVQRFQNRGRTDPPQGATACLFWPDLHSPSRSLSWALPECQSFQ